MNGRIFDVLFFIGSITIIKHGYKIISIVIDTILFCNVLIHKKSQE